MIRQLPLPKIFVLVVMMAAIVRQNFQSDNGNASGPFVSALVAVPRRRPFFIPKRGEIQAVAKKALILESSTSSQFLKKVPKNGNDESHDQLLSPLQSKALVQQASRRRFLIAAAATGTSVFGRTGDSVETTNAASVDNTAASGITGTKGNSGASNNKKHVVFVAGATGETGRRIVSQLQELNHSLSSSVGDSNDRVASTTTTIDVIGGVRDINKATERIQRSSIEFRGIHLDNVPAVAIDNSVTFKEMNVVTHSIEDMKSTLMGVDTLIIATAHSPGKSYEGERNTIHDVDNLGNIKLIEGAKNAGVSKVILLSAILTNAPEWGQEKAPGWVQTNRFFGNVLKEKKEAEDYLKRSGLEYTIVRPAELKHRKPMGTLRVSGEDTINGGTISRDSVASVCVSCAITDRGGSPNGEVSRNKVLELVEDVKAPRQEFVGLPKYI